MAAEKKDEEKNNHQEEKDLIESQLIVDQIFADIPKKSRFQKYYQSSSNSLINKLYLAQQIYRLGFTKYQSSSNINEFHYSTIKEQSHFFCTNHSCCESFKAIELYHDNNNNDDKVCTKKVHLYISNKYYMQYFY